MNNIIVSEKPSNVSWDSIHDLLWRAHESNRKRGIIMKYPSLPGEDIRVRVEEGNGKMFVALDGSKVIGSLAFTVKKRNKWYYKDSFAYICFVGIDPNYKGMGIYRQMFLFAEQYIKQVGFKAIVFDTHEDNQRMIKVNSSNGFQKVDYVHHEGHNSIVLIKYYTKAEYSSFSLYCKYLMRVFRAKKRQMKGSLHHLSNNKE